MILYSKWEHGSKEIKITEEGYLIEGKNFPSWREAHKFLSGGKYVPPSKYFRKSSFSEDLNFRKSLIHNFEHSIFSSLSTFLSKPKGIDISGRIHEIRKIVFAGFSSKVRSYDFEDIFQEVLKGLWIRNLGSCPFDPSKSSFSSYVHMVASCVISNYHAKNKKTLLEDCEFPDLSVFMEDLDLIRFLEGEDIDQKVLQSFLQGKKRVEICSTLGYTSFELSKHISKIKEKILFFQERN